MNLNTWSTQLEEYWYHRGESRPSVPVRSVLAAGEYLWRVGNTVLDSLSTRSSIDTSVIGVSSLTVGGSGKTPLVRMLSEEFLLRGHRPAIVTRGYGGYLKGPLGVDPNLHRAADVGDEPLVLASYLPPEIPVIVSRNRADGARTACSVFDANLIILDDALMQRSLRIDCELVVQGSSGLFGNGRCLPAGPLRRPVSVLRGMAALVLISEPGPSSSPAMDFSSLIGDLPLFDADIEIKALLDQHGNRIPANELSDRNVVAWAGIARPWRFRDLLTEEDARIVHFESFPDHHRYCADDVSRLKHLIESTHSMPVTTAKDAVRWPSTSSVRPYVLDIGLRLPTKETMLDLISEKLKGSNHD